MSCCSALLPAGCAAPPQVHACPENPGLTCSAAPLTQLRVQRRGAAVEAIDLLFSVLLQVQQMADITPRAETL